MIRRMEIQNEAEAAEVLRIQIPSYQVEAELIGFADLPPLKDTVASLQACGETFYGYWVDGELAGAISYKREEDVLDIHRMIVHPAHFRKGIASQLVQYVLGQEQGLEKAIVATGAKNEPAKTLYLRHGFEVLQDQEVAPGVCITLFEKTV
ncbi:GNAT family N-acetyltransferase [Brevibacillus fluminis]|uniref:GNAT family N-acetyltransferase n=1 Tax=Brevibacillus fluminis TaxID=511487 RepID=A0A3M8CZZ0_9BACL|nr:GNAT family N-acetyltransferase [Brevibacillus fluminis]RNB81029.1 GNAT family N-acetyltransferase [Brevibacillus fluminis]